MKFTAIAKVEEWLLPNVSRASIMAMWGKLWLPWMSRGQTKYHTVIFKRKGRKNSLWEEKKNDVSIAWYLKGKLFLNSKNFLSFSVPAFSTSYHFMGNRWRNSGNSGWLYFVGAPKSLQMVTAAMKWKDTYPLEESYNQPRQLPWWLRG